MVYSPVGVKCRECAKLPRSALVALQGSRLAAAVGAALGAGAIIGFAYYFLLQFVGFFFLAFFVAAGMGYVVAEAVLRASRYYRGKETAWIAVGGTLWAFLFPLGVSAVTRLGVSWNAVMFTFAGRGVINWVVMIVACWIAYQRNR
jgi:hypothetical protein